MYDITDLSITDMTRCGAVLRTQGTGAKFMEDSADGIVRHLHENLVNGANGEPAMILTRLFKTHQYSQLDPHLQACARKVVKGALVEGGTKCLTLLATAGREPRWNKRDGSEGHQAIPLLSKEMVQQVPMLSALISQLGLEITTLLKPDPSCLQDLEQQTYNVFHVPAALGSPYIPAQTEFVSPHGVKSVLGFGGILPSGNLFAVIMFSGVSIPKKTADMFKPLALAAKLSLLPFERNVFCSGQAQEMLNGIR